MITSREELDEATRIVAGPTVLIEYVGKKPFATDNVAGSGKSWNGKGDVQAVTIPQAKLLLKYPDQWRITDGRIFGGAGVGLETGLQHGAQAQAATQPPAPPVPADAAAGAGAVAEQAQQPATPDQAQPPAAVTVTATEQSPAPVETAAPAAVATETPPPSAAVIAEIETLDYDQMSDDALRLAFERRFGRKPHASTLRETLVAKLKGE